MLKEYSRDKGSHAIIYKIHFYFLIGRAPMIGIYMYVIRFQLRDLNIFK